MECGLFPFFSKRPSPTLPSVPLLHGLETRGLENATCRITKVTVQKTTSFGAGGVISLLTCLPGVYEELDLMHGAS